MWIYLTSEGKKDMSSFKEEISKRRTFAIISHPDAGKTTLTEKLLLYGGAINLAGSVKGKRTAKHAVSDWMEIEKQRGISVTSSVMQFDYDDVDIENLLIFDDYKEIIENSGETIKSCYSGDTSKGYYNDDSGKAGYAIVIIRIAMTINTDSTRLMKKVERAPVTRSG